MAGKVVRLGTAKAPTTPPNNPPKNPESGAVSYLYDGNGNLTSKTDARTTVTAYVYDALNRLTNRNYTIAGTTAATPNVTYTYDAAGVTNSKGRLTSVSSSIATTNFGAYDALGRVTQSSQVTNGNTYVFPNYTYNRAGALTSQTYPSGKVITTTMDTAGRVAYVQKQAGNYYAGDASNLIQYAAHGAMQQVKLGNGNWDETRFNSRLQPLQVGLGQTSTGLALALTTTNSNRLLLDYGYGTTTNNGNLQTQAIRIGATTLSQSYTYDSINRLLTGGEGTNWSQTYGYDQYGNWWVSAGANYGNTPTLTPTTPGAFNTANNRLTSTSYDLSGNLITDLTGRTFAYDAENHQVSYNGGNVTINATYDYDGEGKRVRQIQNTVTTIFVYDVQGQLAAEYSTQASTVPNAPNYYTTDHLGSTRVVTNGDGTVRGRHDYLPFGEEIASVYGRSSIPGYNATDVRQKFTGKEHDSESNLDYFVARYHSPAQGRFTSVDPENRGATPDDPQTWNGYSYARNNPLLYTDPTGEGIQICDNNNENCAISEFSPEYFERTNQNLRFSGGVINAVNGDGSLTRVGTYTEFGDYEDATGGLLLFTGLARAAVSGAVALVDSAATSLSKSYARMAGSEAGVLRLGVGAAETKLLPQITQTTVAEVAKSAGRARNAQITGSWGQPLNITYLLTAQSLD